jgi:hypothetical protein
LSVSTLSVGKYNMIYEIYSLGTESTFCGVERQFNFPLSSYTSIFTVEDSYSSTNLTFQKHYLYHEQKNDCATSFKTVGERIEYGWVPNISTQGFVPILQQIQIVESSTI